MKKLFFTFLALTTLTIFSKAQNIYTYVSVLDSLSNPEIGYPVNMAYTADNWVTVINKSGVTDANGLYVDTIQATIPMNGGTLVISIFDCNNQLQSDTFTVLSPFGIVFQPVFVSCSSTGGPVTPPKSNAVYLSGNVSDIFNNPIANHQVNYVYLPNMAISFPGTVTTDANGSFFDSIPVKPTQGLVIFSAADCNGGTMHDTVFVDSLFPYAHTQLIYCDTGNTGGGCDANFFPINMGNLMVDFYGVPQPGVNFSWDFGDGITMNTTQPFVSHTYSAAGSYQVCLTVTSNSPVIICTATYCMNFTVINGSISNVISGSVYTGNNFADDATVYLIEYDTINGGILTAIDTVQTTQGLYQFINPPSGWYIIKAAMNPNSFLYNNYLPTYHQNGTTPGSVFWHQASPVYNGVFVPGIQYDVHMVQGVNLGGPGFIGGSVLQGANKTSGGGISNVLVILLDDADQILTYTYTDVDGNFVFDDLPIGDYKIYTEVAGLKTIPVDVSITSTNTAVNDVVVKVANSGIVGSVGVAELVNQNQVNVFPNPATSKLNVTFNENLTGKTVQILITDLHGKTLINENVNIENSAIIDISNLAGGLYLLQLKNETFKATYKVSKL